MAEDSYKTVKTPAYALYKEKGSKFLCYSYHVESLEEISDYLEALRKKYYDATHHCYAWRVGARGEQSRANDDGEPSSTAGKPILGQLLSNEITNTLIVVIRYFGGTKLGVGGLIVAYKESAAAVIAVSDIEERTVDAHFAIEFSYFVMNDVMKCIKDLQPNVLKQEFDNLCKMTLSIRESKEDILRGKLDNIEGISVNFLGY